MISQLKKQLSKYIMNNKNTLSDDSSREMYSYKGKTFQCDAYTIAQLNYALALNKQTERYTLVSESQDQ